MSQKTNRENPGPGPALTSVAAFVSALLAAPAHSALNQRDPLEWLPTEQDSRIAAQASQQRPMMLAYGNVGDDDHAQDQRDTPPGVDRDGPDDANNDGDGDSWPPPPPAAPSPGGTGSTPVLRPGNSNPLSILPDN